MATSIQEIGELTESFNHAGAAIREARRTLQHAYVEFVGSLASALDARDPYTAGHSRRVSEYSLAIGRELGLDADVLDELRIGALLHDIGKIGVPDKILQKPGALNKEEFASPPRASHHRPPHSRRRQGIPSLPSGRRAAS